MLAPLKWLLSYTDLKINTKEEIHELASEMTLTGTKVEEVISKGEEINRVVVAKCLEVRRHENSDHLFVCKLDIGADEPIQIITGAQNMRAGAYVPAALDGSTIAGGRIIKAGKLRGLESNGMMCSFEEIGLDCNDYEGGSNDGIMILQDLGEFRVAALLVLCVNGLCQKGLELRIELRQSPVDVGKAHRLPLHRQQLQ